MPLLTESGMVVIQSNPSTLDHGAELEVALHPGPHPNDATGDMLAEHKNTAAMAM